MLEHKDIIRGQRHVYSAPNLDALAKVVTEGRRQQGMKADYNLVYNELKRQHSRGEQRTIHKASAQKVFITPQEALNGAKAVFLKNIIQNDIESQKEIDRRAAICESCPKLSAMAGCSKGCGLSKIALDAYNKAVEIFHKGSRYNIPTRLKKTYCGVCGCSSAAILPAKLEHFLPDSEEKAAARPAQCWLKKPLSK